MAVRIARLLRLERYGSLREGHWLFHCASGDTKLSRTNRRLFLMNSLCAILTPSKRMLLKNDTSSACSALTITCAELRFATLLYTTEGDQKSGFQERYKQDIAAQIRNMPAHIHIPGFSAEQVWEALNGVAVGLGIQPGLAMQAAVDAGDYTGASVHFTEEPVDKILADTFSAVETLQGSESLLMNRARAAMSSSASALQEFVQIILLEKGDMRMEICPSAGVETPSL